MFFSRTSSLLVVAASIGCAIAGLSTSSNNNIAVYWGQNSRGASNSGQAQQRLLYYCANAKIDVIPLAFMTVITDSGNRPQINFANAGDKCTKFPGTNTLNCPQLASDIASCQRIYKKTILLSVGGATYTEGGFSTPPEAISAANIVWASFGPVQSGSSALRPFGSTVVDGFDFDFESPVSNMVYFANRLRALMDAETRKGTKRYYLTAAPQCPYPDEADREMLAGAVYFDAIFVQFYNNYCGVQSFQAGASSQSNFNFATWDNWAKTVSKNRNVKVFLGVPASSGAAGSGYKSASDLAPIIRYCKKFSSFGGVMIWDASQAYANAGFINAVDATLSSSTKRATRLRDRRADRRA